jgi:hypothetical protein
MKMGVFLLFGCTKRPDLHRNPARPRFSPLSAGSSVLDALWIVVIILEQPAYALIVPSRPIRFWLLILSLQVLPQNKIKLISSEKKLPQLFDFIWLPGNGMPGLNDVKKLRCQTSPRARSIASAAIKQQRRSPMRLWSFAAAPAVMPSAQARQVGG